MPHDIGVSVVQYGDRRNLVMRYIDPATGKHIARSTGTPNRREAERIAAKWEAELRQGHATAGKRITWESFRDRFDREVYPNHAKKTQQVNDTVFNAVERIIRPRQLADVSADRISNFQIELKKQGVSDATVRTYLAHLRSALNWAVKMQLLPAVPKTNPPMRGSKTNMMKGRPISEVEFGRLLDTVEAVVGDGACDRWQQMLFGLWLSGLRLNEGLSLSWDPYDPLHVVTDGEDIFLAISADFEKGNRDRLLPLAPDFCEFLNAIPPSHRSGRVLWLTNRHGELTSYTAEWVSRTISRIGKAANIVVHKNVRTGKTKYASAHDLRRSFGERWARKVMPIVLKELMRHESIETTLKYYVGVNAKETAKVLRDAHRGPHR